MKYIVINLVLISFLFLTLVSYLLGIKPLVVTSNSMRPKIKRGDLVLIMKDGRYAVGDIVSFMKDEGIVTHRVFALKNLKMKKLLETKGDANLVSDNSLVDFNDVLGKVKVVFPLLGFLFIYLQSKYFIYFILLTTVLLLLKKVDDES